MSETLIWKTFSATWTRTSGFTPSTLETSCKSLPSLYKISCQAPLSKSNFPESLFLKKCVSWLFRTSAWVQNSVSCTSLTNKSEVWSSNERTQSTGTEKLSSSPFRFYRAKVPLCPTFLWVTKNTIHLPIWRFLRMTHKTSKSVWFVKSRESTQADCSQSFGTTQTPIIAANILPSSHWTIIKFSRVRADEGLQAVFEDATWMERKQQAWIRLKTPVTQVWVA